MLEYATEFERYFTCAYPFYLSALIVELNHTSESVCTFSLVSEVSYFAERIQNIINTYPPLVRSNPTPATNS